MTDEIVVGLNASPSGRAALEFAARRARLDGRKLRVIHVSGWQPAADVHSSGVETTYHAILPEPGWELENQQGWPGEVLVRESERAALLVVGHYDTAHPEGVDPASVSHYCLTHARCPVLGVRPSGELPTPPTTAAVRR